MLLLRKIAKPFPPALFKLGKPTELKRPCKKSRDDCFRLHPPKKAYPE